MRPVEVSGSLTSLMESFGHSENTGLKELNSFAPLDSDFQYEVVKDKIDALCQSSPTLKVHCESRELTLSGHVSDMIGSARDKIKNIISSVKVRKIEVSKAKSYFLISRESKDISEKLFGDLPEGMVMLDIPRGFRLYASSINLLDQAEAVLEKHLLELSITIKANDKHIISSEPWKQLWDKLMGNTDIKICFQDNNNEDLIMSIVGFTEEVRKALKECEDLLRHRKTVKKKVYLEHDILIDNLQDLLQWFDLGQLSSAVKLSKATSQTATLIGPYEEVEKAKFALQKLMQKHVDNLCITKHGARLFFKNQGKTLIDDVQKKCGCRVFVCDSENTMNKVAAKEKPKEKSESIDDKGSNKKEVNRHNTAHEGAHKNGASSSNQYEEIPVEKPAPVLQLMLSCGKPEDKRAQAIVAPLLSTNPVLEAMTVTKGLKNKGGDRFSNLFSAVFGCRSRLQSGQHFPMVVIGNNYSLNCDYVIFIASQPWDGPGGSSDKERSEGGSNLVQVKMLHSSKRRNNVWTLSECEFDAETVAHLMLDAITTLTKTRNMTSLTSIRLVTFFPSIYYIFCEELKKFSRSVQESSWNPLELLTSRLKYQWFPENDAIKDLPVLQHPLPPPTTQLVIVIDEKEKVNEIKRSLEKGFETAVKYREERIEQPLLKTFSLEEIEMVFTVLNDQSEVRIVLDRLNNYISIEGSEKDIERIQNRYQHIAYMLRQRYIAEKNGPYQVNEKTLYHGTAPQNCHSINHSGFNRSFAGKNAVAFGNGVYFAANASYSANHTYSPVDPNTGERFLYQVKVLVGRHTQGLRGMRAPPCRTENDPFDYYDSLTDKQTDPTMFVVFHDDQAYPEYLITFT